MPPNRRFPAFAWGWPTGGRLQLLEAALAPDDTRALSALAAWLDENDLDDAEFPEHRLFAAITTRFGERLSHLPEYPRLTGLQKLHWTRSRLLIAAARPALEKMAQAGLRVVLLKGACRVALDPQEQKSRAAYDLDLLLGPGDFEPGFEILSDLGWRSNRGESVLGLRARLPTVRARNFKQGRFGDIDLHRFGHKPAHSVPDLDTALLQNIVPVTYYDIPAFIPRAEERLAMALGHGAWDGHSHSDWLVDCAQIINTEPVDWDLFSTIVERRNLEGPAAIALSFLTHQIGLTLPAEVSARHAPANGRARLRHLPALILARDEASLGPGLRRLRKLVAAFDRGRHSGRDRKPDIPRRRVRARKASVPAAGPALLDHQITPAAPAEGGTWQVSAVLEFDMPAVRRRVELEINGPDRNLGHVQALWLHKKVVPARVSFTLDLQLTEADFPLTLSSLNGAYVEWDVASPKAQKYNALPCRVVSLQAIPKAAA